MPSWGKAIGVISLIAGVLPFSASGEGRRGLPPDIARYLDENPNWSHGLSTSKAFEAARRLDPMRDRDLKPDIPGGLRTKLGAQFAPSCMKMLKPEQRTDPSIAERLDLIMQEAMSRMLRCQDNYPELQPYILEWISSARRHVIECDPRTQRELGVGAWNNTRGTTTLPVDTFRIFAAWSYARDILGEPAFSAALFGAPAIVIETVIHEVLHSTSANNRLDHDHIRSIRPDACEDNSTLDRVVVVTALCSESLSFNNDLFRTLGERIAKCGEKRGCEDTFTSANNTVHRKSWIPFVPAEPLKPSQDLHPEQAHSLCQRIQDDAHCWYVRTRTNGAGNRYVQNLPEWKRMKNRVRGRLLELLPRSENQIPAELLKLYPDIQLSFEKQADSRCFKSMFRKAKDGSYYLLKSNPIWKDPLHSRIEDPIRRFTDSGKSLGTHFQRYLVAGAELYSMNAPACADLKERAIAIRALTDFANRVEQDENLEKVGAVAQGDLPNWSSEDFVHIGHAESSPNLARAKWLGAELEAEFREAVAKLHPLSPRFDCEAAGLSPFRTAERVNLGLKKVTGREPAAACSTDTHR